MHEFYVFYNHTEWNLVFALSCDRIVIEFVLGVLFT